MLDPLRIGYLLVTFVVGIACFGTVIMLARRRDDELARWFLLFYFTLSLLVGSALLLALVESTPAAPPTVMAAVQYLESFPGRYGVMVTLPLLAHRVFAVRDRRRDLALVGLTIVTFGLQHLTEYGLGGRWDQAGDVMEDLVFAGVVVYTLGIGLSRLRQRASHRHFAARFLGMLLIGLPLIAHDLFLTENTSRRFYPLWYGLGSLVLTVTLVRRRFGTPATKPVSWGLSPKEREVLQLVQRGLSNKEIAAELSISPNTVKTHLRALFDKAGVRTRVGLLAMLSSQETNDFRSEKVPAHPEG